MVEVVKISNSYLKSFWNCLSLQIAYLTNFLIERLTALGFSRRVGQNVSQVFLRFGDQIVHGACLRLQSVSLGLYSCQVLVLARNLHIFHLRAYLLKLLSVRENIQ